MISPLIQSRGMSVVSLLVGLMVSSMCILTSLTMYKNMIHVAAEAKMDSRHDGQLTAAMLTTQMEVQSAGFGIDDATTDDVIVSSSGSTTQLLWRYYDGSAFKCRGIAESKVSESGADFDYQTIKVIKVDSGCDESTSLSSMTWSDQSTLARLPVVGTLDEYLQSNDRLLDIQISQTTCAPYGAVQPDAHLMVTVEVPSSAVVNGAANVSKNTYQYCLPNTSPPPT